MVSDPSAQRERVIILIVTVVAKGKGKQGKRKFVAKLCRFYGACNPPTMMAQKEGKRSTSSAQTGDSWTQKIAMVWWSGYKVRWNGMSVTIVPRVDAQKKWYS